jgi:hypothetical protein
MSDEGTEYRRQPSKLCIILICGESATGMDVNGIIGLQSRRLRLARAPGSGATLSHL